MPSLMHDITTKTTNRIIANQYDWIKSFIWNAGLNVDRIGIRRFTPAKVENLGNQFERLDQHDWTNKQIKAIDNDESSSVNNDDTGKPSVAIILARRRLIVAVFGIDGFLVFSWLMTHPI